MSAPGLSASRMGNWSLRHAGGNGPEASHRSAAERLMAAERASIRMHAGQGLVAVDPSRQGGVGVKPGAGMGSTRLDR